MDNNSQAMACHVCGQATELCHLTTWGVSGRLLGCNTYYRCPACISRDKDGRSTLSPCGQKHIKLAS